MLSCTLRKTEQAGNLHECQRRGATPLVQRRLDCVADGFRVLFTGGLGSVTPF